MIKLLQNSWFGWFCGVFSSIMFYHNDYIWLSGFVAGFLSLSVVVTVARVIEKMLKEMEMNA